MLKLELQYCKQWTLLLCAFRVCVIIRLILCIRKEIITGIQGHEIKASSNPKENLSELFLVSRYWQKSRVGGLENSKSP